MTSLNAPGFGISLVNQKQFKAKTGVDLLELIDAPTDASGWAGVRNGWGSSSGQPRDRKAQEEEAAKTLEAARKQKGSVSAPVDTSGSSSSGPKNADPELVKKVIKAACAAAIEAEPELTKFDTIVGDGDCGETLAGCANALSKGVDSGKVDLQSAAATCLTLGALIERNMGGTSGAIYALFFTGLVNGFVSGQNASASTAGAKEWGVALLAALDNLGTHTPARPGMRTLVDALDPFCRAMGEGKSLADAVQAARKGAEATKTQTARLGRATYVGDKGSDMPPDPGAWGIAAIVEGIQKSLQG